GRDPENEQEMGMQSGGSQQPLGHRDAVDVAAEASPAEAPTSEVWGEFGQALLSGLLVAAAAACGRLVCPLLFFLDDFQAYHLPGLITVGRLVRAGELPLLTPTTWIAGDLVGEYQYAIFNPFVLVLSVISAGFHSLDAMALSIVLPSLVFVGFAVHH